MMPLKASLYLAEFEFRHKNVTKPIFFGKAIAGA